MTRRIDHGGKTGTLGEYIYDPAKLKATYYADGTLKTRTDRNETTTYTYDCRRLKPETVDGNMQLYL